MKLWEVMVHFHNSPEYVSFLGGGEREGGRVGGEKLQERKRWNE